MYGTGLSSNHRFSSLTVPAANGNALELLVVPTSVLLYVMILLRGHAMV